MRKVRILLGFALLLSCSTVLACKYTIREIGFSTLSKVTYTVYKIDRNDAFFPKQLTQSFVNANIRTIGLSADDSSHPAVQFALNQRNLKFPVYILAAPDERMIAISSSGVNDAVLSSPVQRRLLGQLPESYAAVLLIEGKDEIKNEIARDRIYKACERVTNILPNMPKLVDVGPEMIVVSNADFKQEKVMLWSLGVNQIPEEPIAFVVYGKGRIMGEELNYMQIKGEDTYKLLSIIGADCECGLDRKWMLGYQMPLDWPKKTRQDLADELGFDVDNPMVLNEMSRILAIENKVNVDPSGVSFEPILIDLDEEFEEIPAVEHIPIQKAAESVGTNKTIMYSLVFFVLVIGIAGYVLMKKNKN
jgi:hypothetical protein